MRTTQLQSSILSVLRQLRLIYWLFVSHHQEIGNSGLLSVSYHLPWGFMPTSKSLNKVLRLRDDDLFLYTLVCWIELFRNVIKYYTDYKSGHYFIKKSYGFFNIQYDNIENWAVILVSVQTTGQVDRPVIKTMLFKWKSTEYKHSHSGMTNITLQSMYREIKDMNGFILRRIYTRNIVFMKIQFGKTFHILQKLFLSLCKFTYKESKCEPGWHLPTYASKYCIKKINITETFVNMNIFLKFREEFYVRFGLPIHLHTTLLKDG